MNEELAKNCMHNSRLRAVTVTSFSSTNSIL